MQAPGQDATNVTTHEHRHHAANVSRDSSCQINGNSYDTHYRDSNRLHIEKYEDHRRISYTSGDSSLRPSRSHSTSSRPQISMPNDGDNPPLQPLDTLQTHPIPSSISRGQHHHGITCQYQRTTTWSSVKGFYCQHPRSLSAIIGILIITAIIAIVLPLYFTAEARLKRSLAEAEEEAVAWSRHPPTTVAAMSSALSPTLAGRVAPLSSSMTDLEPPGETHGGHPAGGQG